MFFVFAFITLLGALMTLVMRSIVLSALSMVLSFIGVAGLFLLLGNPMAAALQVIVYSGAIVVLILFVIMLLNQHKEEAPQEKTPVQLWATLSLLSVLCVAVLHGVYGSEGIQKVAALHVGKPVAAVTLGSVGDYLFKHQLLAFEVIGVILLVAMVAAVTLVKREM